MKNITKNKTAKDLQDLLKEKRNALAQFSHNVFQGKTKNVKEGRNIRKEIAQIMTSLTVFNKQAKS